MSFWRKHGVSIPPVQFVRTDLEHVRYRWVVAHLLAEQLCTILQASLVGLAEHGVQGFVKEVSRIDVGQTLTHHQLHPFEWVSCQSGSV